jgi:hypothetical protein
MPKAIPIISAFHNLSAGDLADEHGQLCAQIADLETRKRAIAGEVIRRGLAADPVNLREPRWRRRGFFFCCYWGAARLLGGIRA